MNSRTFIAGGRVVCPATGLDAMGTLVVSNGVVEAVESGAFSPPAGARVLDATACIVAPGFVDLHAHFCDPGEEHKEDLASGGRAAVRGGFTSVVVGAQTTPANDTRAVTEMIVRRAASLSGCRVLPMGALTLGRGGRRLTEMFDLREAGAVCFGEGDSAVADAGLLRRAMEYARAVGLPVFEHPEDRSLAGVGVMHEGAVSTRLGLNGVPAVAEVAVVVRDLALCAATGARLHLGPISAADSVSAIRRAKAEGWPVTCAVTAAHLHLTDEAVAAAYSPQLRSRPPFRAEADREALRAGVADGTIDAISSGHRPQSPVEKDLEFDLAEPGLVGLGTALGLTLRLVEDGRVPLVRALAALTDGPARVLSRRATLTAGDPADVVVFDPVRRVRSSPGEALGRARNTPFLGHALPGEVRYTLVGGELRSAPAESST
jgi:dihydroorotase